METKYICPLGSKCEDAKDGILYRCAWYTELRGMKDGKEDVQYGCAIAWLPALSVENARTNIGQTAAIESLRNETIKRQDMALAGVLKHAAIEHS